MFTQIGPIIQLAYAPIDFDAALQFWTKRMGVGPFYHIPDSGLENLRFRGKPSDFKFGLAIAYWGDLQIELIHQHEDAPSDFREWREAGKSGVHHVCVLTKDMEQASQICVNANADILLEATSPPEGKRVMYVDPGGPDSTLVEILEHSQHADEVFAMIRAASVDWDGTDPLRRF